MKRLTLATAAALTLAAPVSAQTETEEEQLVFLDVAGRSVQLPSSFVAAACGLSPEQITTDLVGTTDPACALDQDTAVQMGLTEENGDSVDLTRQGFVNVELPDGEMRVQMPRAVAAQLCEVEESALADDQASVRQVGCELTQAQASASIFPGLTMNQGGGGAAEDAGGSEGADGGSGG
jgi:hypothetical protein